LSMIARAADGSMRDALSLTDQVLALGDGTITADRVRDTLGLVAEDEFLRVLDLIAERRAGDVFAAVARLVDLGVDLGLFLAGFGEMVRAQLAVTLGGAPGDLSERARTALDERRGQLAAGDLLRMLSALSELEPRFRRSTQQQLLLETALVRFALLDRTVAIENVLRQLASGPAEPPRGGEGPRSLGSGRGASGRGGGSRATDAQGPAGVPRLSDVAGERRASAVIPTPSMAWSAVGTQELEWSDPAPMAADVSPGHSAEVHVADLNAIAGAWDEVVAAVRRDRPLIATLLEHALPTGASPGGALTLQVDTAAVLEGLNARMVDTVAALRPRIAGLNRIVVRSSLAMPASQTAPRMTVETVKADTLALLTKRDPLLAAAIEALDLDLAD